MEIMEESVLIFCGETGCEKTTKVIQFLFKAGYSPDNQNEIIGITQPHSAAVLAMAKEVSSELGYSLGNEVVLKVRRDKESDLLLERYSVIIVDGVDERTLNTDILIGMLSRIVGFCNHKKEDSDVQISSKNTRLKLVLMFVTPHVEDFISNRELFLEPPTILNISVGQVPVITHFSRKTPKDYLLQAYKKVLSIHKKDPPGGILVFVTGQKEVEYLCDRLREASEEFCEDDINKMNNETSALSILNLKDNKDTFWSVGSISNQQTGMLNSSETEACQSGNGSSFAPLFVLPLYAMLSDSLQLRVFEKVPDGERLVVVSTNIAEISLTVPGIKYVVDTGKVKVMKYNHEKGMTSYEVMWISRFSADRRVERAGRDERTTPDHCYRLYSSRAFSKGYNFSKMSCPEISNVPVDRIVLLLKSLDIINEVEVFPLPTHLSAAALEEADNCLRGIAALDEKGTITSLGRAMALYPMSARYSRAILTVIEGLKIQGGFTRKNLMLGYAAATVAALSFQDPHDDMKGPRRIGEN